jgi:hypothetical protein
MFEVPERVLGEDRVGVDAQLVVIAIGDVLLPGGAQRPDLAVLVADGLDHGDPAPERAGNLHRAVRAVVGDDHDPVGLARLAQQRLNRAGDRLFLVVRRDKRATAEELRSAVLTVNGGGSVISPSLAGHLLQAYSRASTGEPDQLPPA